jgi:hypothetical protein
MRSTTVVQRTLEIDAAREPLTGRLTSNDQPEQRFRGWLELFALVEALRIAADAEEQSNKETPRRGAKVGGAG